MKRYTIFIALLSLCSISFTQTLLETDDQLKLINLDCLHERGFTGKGVTIAHFDDGCDGCDQMEVFEYARSNGYWKESYDFVKDTALLFEGLGSHGTNTVSIVHGYLADQFVGTAYDANVLIARTENVRSETHREEQAWRKAVDWSLENGADIITSSLQYNQFDQGEGDYTYQDMDGATAIITQAADYAASKGIIVVALQGNFGNDAWYYVSAPGDADSVITVGAATKEGAKAGFSGYGPTSDGRIKPDIMAMGQATAVVNPNGRIRRGNGTSFAAPTIAGMIACLKEAHPDRSNMQIISAVRQSGSHYHFPSAIEGYGYGVADACKADEILAEMDVFLDKPEEGVQGEEFTYKIKNKKLIVELQDIEIAIDKIIVTDIFENAIHSIKGNAPIDLDKLPEGDYLAKIFLSNKVAKTIYFKN